MSSPALCPAKRLRVCWTWTCLRASFTAMANWPYWLKSAGRGPDRSPTGARPQARVPQNMVEIYRWTAAQLQSEFEPVLAHWPKTLQLEIDGLGQVLFCHSTPRSETEVFTRLTSEDRQIGRASCRERV